MCLIWHKCCQIIALINCTAAQDNGISHSFAFGGTIAQPCHRFESSRTKIHSHSHSTIGRFIHTLRAPPFERNAAGVEPSLRTWSSSSTRIVGAYAHTNTVLACVRFGHRSSNGVQCFCCCCCCRHCALPIYIRKQTNRFLCVCDGGVVKCAHRPIAHLPRCSRQQSMVI